MSTQPAVRRWTYEEFARLPNDGNRYEVIGGELFVSASPRPIHQEISARLTELIRPFLRQYGLGGRALPGPIDVLLGEGDFLAPDFIYVRQDRVHLVSTRGAEGPPDLVVEIVSDGTKSRDRGIKRRRYAAFGVAEYWIVDWERKRVEIHRKTDDKARQTEIATTSFDWQPIPGGPVLTIDVAELLDDF